MLTQYNFFFVQGEEAEKYLRLIVEQGAEGAYRAILAEIPWCLGECMSTPIDPMRHPWLAIDPQEYVETDDEGNRWYFSHDSLCVGITVYSGIFWEETEDSTSLSFEAERFRVELHHGKKLSYKFFDREILIFAGDDFRVSPLHADDSIETFLALLSFLSLQKGDTDSGYFDDYTPAQLSWRDDHADELAMARDEIARACEIEDN